MSKMPKQQPGKSEQEVETPGDFLQAVKGKLGTKYFSIDLAADEENAVSGQFYSERDNALIQDWVYAGWAWLNPPYADIHPWVEKANHESKLGAHVAMLVPASVGSNWWADHVHEQAYVLFASPRITFVGHTSPYPKDLALLLYTPFGASGYDTWRWK